MHVDGVFARHDVGDGGTTALLSLGGARHCYSNLSLPFFLGEKGKTDWLCVMCRTVVFCSRRRRARRIRSWDCEKLVGFCVGSRVVRRLRIYDM